MADSGADQHLTPFEALMWRSEVNPMLRSTGVVLELLDEPPDRKRLIAAHEWGTRRIVRLRQRVVEDPLNLSSPRWAVDRDFDLAYHLRIVRLPEPGSIEQVLELAQGLAMAPFDRARPLWEAVLVEGLPDGGAAYLLKLHHSIADGQGTIQMLDILHSDRPEPGHGEDLPVPAPDGVSGRGLSARALLGAPRRVVREALSATGRLPSVAGHLLSSPQSIAGGVRYAQSLGRMLGPPPARSSPLLQQRSLGRRFGMIEIPLADLSAAGKAAGGTVNDAFIAGLAGGMRRYHEEHGVAVEELTVALPISMRTADDPIGSNRFAGARIAAPVGTRDPRERMRIIGERVKEARDEAAINFMDALSPVMSRLPATLVASMTERVTQSIDLQASNVRGLDRLAYVAGARVSRMYGFGAAPGPAVMVTLFSYHGTCCIAVNVNAAAVPDHELFVRCMEEGLAEVTASAAGTTAAAPRRKRASA